ncbi:alpha/beta hydrolase [Nocardioides sp. LHD-245]|uniref:alpha/beta fold hydrolase n=1 Tax=Nocardioides sp. LHD-245 TaxID=3051387 RepID=UPI0027DEB3F5|nr:alpha/beta hydrolase [Nocardioides sp. LHD-245]
MRQIQAGGHVFDCEEGGAGEPVVLLHGFPESAASWRPVARRLRQAGMATLAPNQRGYSDGARPEGVEAYAVERLTEDVLALAEAWGAPRFHLVGHDWGAAVAWHVAARHPDRVATLTALSVPHLAAYAWAIAEDEDQRRRSEYVHLFRTPGKAEHVLLGKTGRPHEIMYGGIEDAAMVAEHTAVITRAGALTAALNWYRAIDFPTFVALPPVTVPTTYLWSDEDPALGRAGAAKCQEFVVGDYEYVELAGANHWLPENEPDAVAEAIVRRTGAAPLPALGRD